MNRWLKKIIRQFGMGEQGFSMVQGLIAASVIGGISLAIVQQNKLSSQQHKSSQTNLALFELQGQIVNYLLSEGSCTASFGGSTLTLPNVGQSQAVTAIKDRNGTIVYQTGNTYNLNQVKIESMLFTRTASGGTLQVMFDKVGRIGAIGARDARKDFVVNAKWNGAGNLTECFSDLSNAVDTSVAQIIARFCPDPTAPLPSGLYFDTGTGLCESTAQFGTTTIQTDCPHDQAVTTWVYDSATRQYAKSCGPIYNLPPNCPNDTLVRRKSDGSFDCVKPNCPGYSLFQGFDAAGNSVCLNCGHGEILMVENGSWACKTISCYDGHNNSQQYFLGFNATGNTMCNTLVEANNCPSGGRLVASPGGSVRYECCTPACGDTNLHCAGTAYQSSNNCGTCIGTRPPACGDTSTQCIGSYPSSNGCGSCQGTKAPQNALWTGWSPTSDYRIKPGATCDCNNNTIVQQRKYNRTCSLGSCGGSVCVGPSEIWQDDSLVTCAPNLCFPFSYNFSPSKTRLVSSYFFGGTR